MAKRKIVWSHRANIKLFQILDFYSNRNQSSVYSQKLYQLFSKQLLLLKQYPEMGIQTEEDGVKGLIIEEFILFYEITADKIIIHTVWDSRQNPNELKLK